jgi:polyisoprenoid-binding protein YceI
MRKEHEMATSVATDHGIEVGSWRIDPVHSHVGFAVAHMGVSTFRGRFEDYDGALVAGDDGAPRLEGSVRAGSIAVKDENLAAHLGAPDFFDTERYPEIRFSSTDVRFGEDGELEVDGELTIKDHTHSVTARGVVRGPHRDIAGNEKVGVELSAVVDRTEYGLDFNAPLPGGGVALENDVTLEVALELVKEA